jgi:hypothetical protein
MIRFAAFASLVAALVTASFVWADDRPGGNPSGGADTVGKGSITTRGIRDGTIQLRDLHGPLRRLVKKPGPRGEDGQDGQDGFDGADGFDGVDGLDGQDGVSGYAAVNQKVAGPEGATTPVTAEVDCPSGTSVLGGGAVPTSNDPAATFDVVETRPQDDNSGWRVSAVRAGSAAAWTLEVRAFCADVTP